MMADVIGRTPILRKLASYVTSGENALLLVTCGRAAGLGNCVFSLISFQRLVLACLAEWQLPLVAVEGDRGAGKSALLAAVASTCTHILPSLVVYRQEEGSAATLLRRLYSDFSVGIDDPTDEEIVTMPIVKLVGRHAGVLLLIDAADELESPAKATSSPLAWLPSPLPHGVRCVVARNDTEHGACLLEARSKSSIVSIKCPPLTVDAAREIATQAGVSDPEVLVKSSMATNPSWLKLACSLPCDASRPSDTAALVGVVLDELGKEIGVQPLSTALCACVCSRKGLYASEISEILIQHASASGDVWSIIAARLSPVLRITETVRCSPILVQAVESKYMHDEARTVWHRRLADFFGSCSGGRKTEVPYHLAELGDREGVLAAITEWDTFESLVADKQADIMAYCKAAGGFQDVFKAMTVSDTRGAEAARRKRCLGTFMSQVGDFGAARQVLLEAMRMYEAQNGQDDRELGRVALQVAANEVRYWDSRRDWGSVDALKTLMDSAQMAVRICGAHRQRYSDVLEHANALNLWANGCFKAGCVTPPEEAFEHLGRADAAIETVKRMLEDGPPSQILGRALLVGGVAKMVRGHVQQRQNMPGYRRTLRNAAELLYSAERVLKLAVGEVSQFLMYTHGNLAELFLQDVQSIREGYAHFVQCCEAGVRALGADHPNVVRKLREFRQRLFMWGARDAANDVLSGDLSKARELLEMVEKEYPLRDLDEWVASEPRNPTGG